MDNLVLVLDGAGLGLEHVVGIPVSALRGDNVVRPSANMRWYPGPTVLRYLEHGQFRLVFGTSPYRYLLMRRLDLAREEIHRGRPLADVAVEAGFADQAHLTRMFRDAFGLTPARYRALRVRRTGY